MLVMCFVICFLCFGFVVSAVAALVIAAGIGVLGEVLDLNGVDRGEDFVGVFL